MSFNGHCEGWSVHLFTVYIIRHLMVIVKGGVFTCSLYDNTSFNGHCEGLACLPVYCMHNTSL